MRRFERLCATLLAPVLMVSAGSAQLTSNVGPNPAPEGCPISVSLTNDTELIAAFFNCPFRVLDANFDVVYTPDCFQLELLVGPLGTVTWIWDQVDDAGNPVAPGDYWVDVGTVLGPQLQPLTIGGVDTGLHLEGTAAIGTDAVGDGRHVVACSPQDPGQVYWVLASLTNSQGVPTCGGTLPLDPDPLFQLSLLPDAVLNGAVGVFDAAGYADTTRFPIPDNEGLVGLPLVLAFLVLDPGQSCPVVRVSEALPIVIQEGAIPFPE